MNNKNTHTYMHVDVMFTHMHEKKGINIFSERDKAALVKESKQLYGRAMPGKPVVIPLKPD